MSILVTYSSKHGATRGIAERIANALTASNLDVEIQDMKAVKDLIQHDAVVIGSAVYFGSWMREATAFVHAHREQLATRPVWLFSSGPVGTETIDAEGHDVREAAKPKEFAELAEMISPREHVIFFGALDPDRYGLTERLIRALPAGKKLLIEGDFRDWDEIEHWATSIARELTGVSVTHDVSPNWLEPGTGRSCQ